MAKKSQRILTPLDEITDGHSFQRIVAEYFRCLKNESNGYSISNIVVKDSGIGPDDCCDILVEFFFEDVIDSHSVRWVVECKCHTKNIGERDIDGQNIELILKQHNATGYLLVCKKDASTSLKRRFDSLNEKGTNRYVIWNGHQLWHKCIEFESFIKAFFPLYYNMYIVKDEKEFLSLADKYEKEGGVK